MFLLKTDFRKDLLIITAITILLGAALVAAGGFITDKYFSHMVSGIIGEYGEYDVLLTLSGDKEEIALSQINNVISSSLPGAQLAPGPKVVGSSNYLLKLPAEYRNEEVYTNIDGYFADIPGLMSKTIITEPRLLVRGFRGDTLPLIRPMIENIEGIDFVYPIGDGLDIVVQRPELVSSVKEKVNEVFSKYKILEIRYPLNQHPENLLQLKEEVMNLIDKDFSLTRVEDVTNNMESSRITLLKNLNEMKTFLISYASKIMVRGIENSENIPVGSELIMPGTGNSDRPLILKVIDNSNQTLISLIEKGELEGLTSHQVFLRNQDGTEGQLLGEGQIINPRQDLATALDKLNEITPNLNIFLEQSEQLVEYSSRLSGDLANINQGLNGLEETSQNISNSLRDWQEKNISLFLDDLLKILDEIKNNTGNLNQVQSELVKTSNKLRGAAGMIEEKIVFVPRNNSLYQQLNEMKDLFLKVSTTLDSNYDLVSKKLNDMEPVLASIDDWKQKIVSLSKIEDTLNSGARWQEIETIINKIEKTADIIDTRELQDKLGSIQKLLLEVKTAQLPVIIDQLEYIKTSLPDLQESEIAETLNLIDKYIAGQVIPGDQIQLLLEGQYSDVRLIKSVKSVINNPAVTILSMEAGQLQPNPRSEVFNILIQVRAVVSTIIALVFTMLVLILDQSLLISVIKLNHDKGYLYSFLRGGLIFSMIYLISGINFPYLNIFTIIIIGGILGLIIGLLSEMLNPVKKEEWEAGQALGFSFSEIMHEIIIPSGKPGLLYLVNYPRIIFK